MSDLSALHDMTLFVEVARAKNFSAAGRHLGVPVATLSRRIAAMEREFGVRLFDRTTRRVELTEAGARYFERCAHLADEARLAQEALRETATRPSGHLRLSMPVDLGVYVIGPLLPEFARQFPGITLDLDLRGAPTHPDELAAHECLLLRAPRMQSRWRLERDGVATEVTVRGRTMLNNQGLMRQLVERGMGIGVLAPDLARDALASGRLVRVLAPWTMAPLPVHAVTSSRLQPASVKAFVGFLADRLAG